MPLTESLPFYHCRLAMFVVLLIPGVSRVKQYFAVLGTFGTLAAFVYPVPDPYPFPPHRYPVLLYSTPSPLWKFLDLSFEGL